jgi:transposase
MLGFELPARELLPQDNGAALVEADEVKGVLVNAARQLANLPPCLVGMEACVGAHHLSRRLKTLCHDPRLVPARYVRAFLKGNKNDFRDAEAIEEAVQRPTMRFEGGLLTLSAKSHAGGS